MAEQSNDQYLKRMEWNKKKAEAAERKARQDDLRQIMKEGRPIPDYLKEDYERLNRHKHRTELYSLASKEEKKQLKAQENTIPLTKWT